MAIPQHVIDTTANLTEARELFLLLSRHLVAFKNREMFTLSELDANCKAFDKAIVELHPRIDRLVLLISEAI